MKIDKLTIAFNGKKVLSDFSIEFEEGKTTAFLAPSGFGKTTLLNWICQKEMENGRTVSFAFQEPRLLDSATVLENVSLPLRNKMTRKQADEKALAFLKSMKIEEKATLFPTKLSGGEKQRVSLARALAFPSQVLLLDEAFNSIDEKTKIEIIEYTKALLKEEKRTTIFVTHDKKEAELLCDQIKTGL